MSAKIYSIMKNKQFLILLVLAAMCNACSEPASETPQTTEIAQTADNKVPMQRETVLGPVHAVVHLDNQNPTLGEQITLTLTVDAAPKVKVIMPDFGDQLGKFGIADYKATENIREDSRQEYVQRYTLDLPMSGKLKTPSFLIEFTDNRDEAENPGKIEELLTEEMTFEVASVFADGKTPEELYPLQEKLPELVLPTAQKSQGWLWAALAALAAAMIGGAIWLKTRTKSEIIFPPDFIALKALDKMEKREIPTDFKSVDAWYVELSDIVRKYIEGRFDLHAPRLTTEEFFELAKTSDELTDAHKNVVRKLLERADRVKFTHYVPPTDESREMLQAARTFVEETREIADHA